MLTSAGSRGKREPATAESARTDAKVVWRDVALYTALAYALAWSVWFALVPHFFDLLTAKRTPHKLDVAPVYILGMFAPAVAAVVMRLFVSKEGLRGSLGPAKTWRFYALAVMLGAVLVNLVLAADSVTGLGAFTWHGRPALGIEYAALVFDGLTFSAFFTFGEEYGRRGYLMRKLLPLGEVRAAVVVGLIWAPWHLPLLVAGLNYPGVAPAAALAMFIPVTVAMSLVFGRIFVASGGAVLVTTVLHGSFNAFGDRLADPAHLTGSPLIVSPGGALGVGVLLATALAVYAIKGRLTHRRPLPAAVPTRTQPHARPSGSKTHVPSRGVRATAPATHSAAASSRGFI